MDTAEQQRQQLLEDVRTLPAEVLQEVSNVVARLRQETVVIAAVKSSSEGVSSTPYDLLKESGFIGCAEGPPDLAANHKAYLEKHLMNKYDRN